MDKDTLFKENGITLVKDYLHCLAFTKFALLIH